MLVAAFPSPAPAALCGPLQLLMGQSAERRGRLGLVDGQRPVVEGISQARKNLGTSGMRKK